MAQLENSPLRDVTFNVDVTNPSLRKRIMFNWFEVEKITNGCLVRLAWISRTSAVEIWSVIISRDGIVSLRDNSTLYVQAFDLPEPFLPQSLDKVALTAPPEFSNYIRLSHSNGWAEVIFFLIPISEIAEKSKSATNKDSFKPIPVAVAHSNQEIHLQLTLSILGTL